MNTVGQATGRAWTADEFLAAEQGQFGDAWRYELVDGRVIAHAAPSPDHGAIVSGLIGALANRLHGNPNGCRPEAGSGAVPKRRQRNTARIPDVMVRCGDLPRVAFEVISPSELRAWRVRDRKRRDLQDVEGIQEIVELYQSEPAAHIYRREPGGSWSFQAADGLDAVLNLISLAIEVPMAEIYEFVTFPFDQPPAP